MREACDGLGQLSNERTPQMQTITDLGTLFKRLAVRAVATIVGFFGGVPSPDIGDDDDIDRGGVSGRGIAPEVF